MDLRLDTLLLSVASVRPINSIGCWILDVLLTFKESFLQLAIRFAWCACVSSYMHWPWGLTYSDNQGIVP